MARFLLIFLKLQPSVFSSDAPWQSRCRLGPSAVGSSTLPVESWSLVRVIWAVQLMPCSRNGRLNAYIKPSLNVTGHQTAVYLCRYLCRYWAHQRIKASVSLLRPNRIRHSSWKLSWSFVGIRLSGGWTPLPSCSKKAPCASFGTGRSLNMIIWPSAGVRLLEDDPRLSGHLNRQLDL
jgi:hypothetical protein